MSNRPWELEGGYLSRIDAILLIATGEPFVNSAESNGVLGSIPWCWWLSVHSIDWMAVSITRRYLVCWSRQPMGPLPRLFETLQSSQNIDSRPLPKRSLYIAHPSSKRTDSLIYSHVICWDLDLRENRGLSRIWDVRVHCQKVGVQS